MPPNHKATGAHRHGGAPRRGSVAREVWAIVFFFAAAFLLLSLISYDHGDPSLFSRTKRIPLNHGGRIGANLAEGLVQIAGLASFLFCGLLISIGLKLFEGARALRVTANIFWQAMVILTLSAFLSLQFGPVGFGGAPRPAGGMLGGWAAAAMRHYLNQWGATLATLCLFFVALTFATPSSVNWVLSKAAAGLRKTWPTTRQWLRRIGPALWALLKRGTAKALYGRRAKSAEPAIESWRETAPPSVDTPERGDSGTSLIDVARIAESALESLKPGSTPRPRRAAPRAAPVATKPARNGSFTLPPLGFLNEAPASRAELDRERLVENSRKLEQKLTDYGIEGQVVAVRPGPVITMYEFKPGPGVKISQIAALADDLSLALSAQSVRIVAPIPGKSVVGIEIPNETREKVFLREILATEEFQSTSGTAHLAIPLAVGKDISGAPIVADLARMPHLLIAGAPGAGKSVFINSLICSLLYKFTPNDMRLIMVDPKQLELNLYENIPHLLLPVVDDPRKASTALKWAVNEMERRYKVMAKAGVRNIAGFNQKLEKEGEETLRAALCPERSDGMPEPTSLAHLFDHDEKGRPRVERLPFILVIIDEFADLMMVAPKDIETSVTRLAQKARASGIHLVIATQRPSVDVITGLIKANLPSRVSFQVASKVDSRTILDGIGAEKLLGQGDMLFVPPGLSRLVRLHGAFVNEEEIGRICDQWRAQGAPVYREEILLEPEDASGESSDGAGDELYGQAVAMVREMGQASASMIQRRLKVGYNRAARMVEAMEAQGIVGPADGAKPREVIL